MEFSCPACGSPAIVLPDLMTDQAPVRCRRCETVLCTLGQFRSRAEHGAAELALDSGVPAHSLGVRSPST